MAEFNIVDMSSAGPYKGTMESVDGLVIHHTGGRGDINGVVNTLNQRGLGVTYVMDRDGTVARIVPEGAKTAHAANYNSRYEGIEIIAKDDGDLTPQQLSAFVEFGKWHSSKYGYDIAKGMVGHGDLTQRKDYTGKSKQLTEGRMALYTILAATGRDLPKDLRVGSEGREVKFSYAGLTSDMNPFVAAKAKTNAASDAINQMVAPIPAPRLVRKEGKTYQPITMSVSGMGSVGIVKTMASSIIIPPTPALRSQRPSVLKQITSSGQVAPMPAPRYERGRIRVPQLSQVRETAAGVNSFYDTIVKTQAALGGIKKDLEVGVRAPAPTGPGGRGGKRGKAKPDIKFSLDVKGSSGAMSEVGFGSIRPSYEDEKGLGTGLTVIGGVGVGVGFQGNVQFAQSPAPTPFGTSSPIARMTSTPRPSVSEGTIQMGTNGYVYQMQGGKWSQVGRPELNPLSKELGNTITKPGGGGAYTVSSGSVAESILGSGSLAPAAMNNDRWNASTSPSGENGGNPDWW